MPHLPVFLWIVFAIIPVVIGLLLLVEATVVRPSIEAERHAKAPEPEHSRPRGV
jgi:hypothetical protein